MNASSENESDQLLSLNFGPVLPIPSSSDLQHGGEGQQTRACRDTSCVDLSATSFVSKKAKVRRLVPVRAEMAQKRFELDPKVFSCSICMDLLKDPVVIPCGHNYCKDCIKAHWDIEAEEGNYSCPQCRQTFTTRPSSLNSIILSALVDDLRAGHQDVPADASCAGHDDVACDVCTSRKRKATAFCLVCLISFCEEHIQPHVQSPAYKKHRLVLPSKNLQENICPQHNELMRLFCRSDQQLICYLCSVEDHRGHVTVSAAAETAEKRRELDGSRQKLQKRIQVQEEELKMLRAMSEAVSRAADRTAEDSEETLTQMISDVKQKIRTEQDGHLSQLKELQEKVGQEIAKLKRKDAQLKTLSTTEDHVQFLHDYAPLSDLGEDTAVRRRATYFEGVRAAVSEVRDKLQEALKQDWTKIWEVPQSQPQPWPREEFLTCFRQITLDPNTINKWLFLSENCKIAALLREESSYPFHPDRFNEWHQVLSTKFLTGCCYWEVEMTGAGVCVAVSYQNINRAWRSPDCGFGLNDKSWTLNCYNGVYDFWHNNVRTAVSGPRSSRVGVYLDHDAGVLSYYSVSESTMTMTLLHSVQTTFAQPLYAGLGFLCYETIAEILDYEGNDEE